MQDVYCLVMNDFKRAGIYLEIGAGSPHDSSNSFLLEAQFSWSGISVEYNEALFKAFTSQRKNKCILADATTLDYRNLLNEEGFPLQVDYLSLDIDPPSNTYRALKRCLDSQRRFSVITYEHDKYYYGDRYMKLSRELLHSSGYTMVAGNVKVFGKEFEDWWIDPSLIAPERWAGAAVDSFEFMHLPFFQPLYSSSRGTEL